METQTLKAGELNRVYGAWSRPGLCPEAEGGRGKSVSRRQMRQDHAGRGQGSVRTLAADTDSGAPMLGRWARVMRTVAV